VWVQLPPPAPLFLIFLAAQKVDAVTLPSAEEALTILQGMLGPYQHQEPTQPRVRRPRRSPASVGAFSA